ncbi:hypothetical protein KW782_03755 [Candidatus Parcubacteria bacterium]|nr:hypothetical protein [Candidatus Parcubacteria bacterium]
MSERFPKMMSFGLIVLLAALYTLGLYFQLYWRLTWYDRMLHLLGGFWVGFVASGFIFFDRFVSRRLSRAIVVGIVSAIIVGTVWELFELIVGFTALIDPTYAADTMSDFICDIIGGIAGACYYVMRIKNTSVWIPKK